MKLVNLTMTGYRRFEKRTMVDLNGDVIAIVGPNEAGKSSVLMALASLSREGNFSYQERTDGHPEAPEVSVHFVLEPGDLEDLASELNGAAVDRWTLTKRGGREYTTLYPEPPRDLAERHEMRRRLEQHASANQLHSLAFVADVPITPAYEAAWQALNSKDDDLDTTARNAIKHLVDALKPLVSGPAGTAPWAEFQALLVELRNYRERSAPKQLIGEALVEIAPQFLLFTEQDRSLQTTYDIPSLSNQVPAALENLAAAAQLDLNQLRIAVAKDVDRDRFRLINRANQALQTLFSMTWRQMSFTVQLFVNGQTLSVYVRPLDNTDPIELEERSAGLRYFIALRAFLERHKGSEPVVLLIDEAETHLHYDAQADLINVLTEQPFADKIIYTTHSAGCLPRDLGVGVRVVAPISNTRSTVRNSVWSISQSNKPWMHASAGISPLLMAMGAATLAFLPSRHALMGEGITDAMLYPTLFREATGLRFLSYQVLPGLAQINPAGFAALQGEAGSIVFITDGDEDGKRYQRALETAKVLKHRVFGLNDIIGDLVTLEDLILPDHYMEAIKRLLPAAMRPHFRHDSSCLPTHGRSAVADAWRKPIDDRAFDKRDIAQQLLDLKSAAARKGETLVLLDPVHAQKMRDLHGEIEAALIAR